MSRIFLDSNVLIYSQTALDPRMDRAVELIRAGGTISVQCLNEFVSVARRKLLMSWEQIHEALILFDHLLDPPLSIDRKIHLAGLAVAERYTLSTYDAMIAAAAIDAGCDTLLSEDMHHGLVIDNRLTIANPFLPN